MLVKLFKFIALLLNGKKRWWVLFDATESFISDIFTTFNKQIYMFHIITIICDSVNSRFSAYRQKKTYKTESFILHINNKTISGDCTHFTFNVPYVLIVMLRMVLWTSAQQLNNRIVNTFSVIVHYFHLKKLSFQQKTMWKEKKCPHLCQIILDISMLYH